MGVFSGNEGARLTGRAHDDSKGALAMADAAVPLLNLAILGSFFSYGVFQLRQLENDAARDDDQAGE